MQHQQTYIAHATQIVVPPCNVLPPAADLPWRQWRERLCAQFVRRFSLGCPLHFVFAGLSACDAPGMYQSFPTLISQIVLERAHLLPHILPLHVQNFLPPVLVCSPVLGPSSIEGAVNLPSMLWLACISVAPTYRCCAQVFFPPGRGQYPAHAVVPHPCYWPCMNECHCLTAVIELCSGMYFPLIRSVHRLQHCTRAVPFLGSSNSNTYVSKPLLCLSANCTSLCTVHVHIYNVAASFRLRLFVRSMHVCAQMLTPRVLRVCSQQPNP